MRTLIQSATVVLLALGLAGQVLAASKGASPNGVWKVVSRTCTDGSSANDGFKLARDTMILTIDGSSAKVSELINDKSYSQTAVVNQITHLIVDKDSDGRADYSLYTVDDRHLKIYSVGFSDGGSCAQNQALVTAFVKQK